MLVALFNYQIQSSKLSRDYESANTFNKIKLRQIKSSYD